MDWFDTFDHFEHKMGSKIWPSEDPEDSPFDTFICKHCGRSMRIQMYGSRFIGDKSFEDQARDILGDHLKICLEWSPFKYLLDTKQIALIKPEQLSPGFWAITESGKKIWIDCTNVRIGTAMKGDQAMTDPKPAVCENCGCEEFLETHPAKYLHYPEWVPGHHMTVVIRRPVYTCIECGAVYGEKVKAEKKK